MGSKQRQSRSNFFGPIFIATIIISFNIIINILLYITVLLLLLLLFLIIITPTTITITITATLLPILLLLLPQDVTSETTDWPWLRWPFR